MGFYFLDMTHHPVFLHYRICPHFTCCIPIHVVISLQIDFTYILIISVICERELVDTNAYKLQPSLSERVIVDGHGCHTALHFGVKAKENQDKVPTLYWLPKLHKNPIKQDLLQILVLVRQQNFLNC